MTEPQDTFILNNVESLKVYFDPFRLKIVQLLASAPRTIHEVAEALNVPFTRLYYQFNLLEQHGIIRVVGTGPRTGAVEEKRYRIAAYNFVVARDLLTTSPGEIPPHIAAAIEVVFEGTRSQLEESIRAGVVDVGVYSPDPASVMLRRTVLRLSSQQARQLHEDLNALLMRYMDAQTSDCDTVDIGLAVAVFPAVLAVDEKP
jgi:DNA-binding transcriptional ArsR family regulator